MRTPPLTRPAILAMLAAAGVGVLVGLSLPTRPAPTPEPRVDIPGCDGRAAWRLAAVEALFTGQPRRPDIQASPIGLALCRLFPEPAGEEAARAIAADPSGHHALGLRIHAAWTAYVGEQPRLPAAEIDRLRRDGHDVRALADCVRRIAWLLSDIPFGTDPIVRADSPQAARAIATAAALQDRQPHPDALAVCASAAGERP